ncbi:MAG: RNA polymerase [Candidatus Thermoplasmatota archaeon]|nr:RNA polymerase [Candidatus Thermoplasmatota archaeon]MBS3790918.1 RNA polymerase [Candidatus Thermoplasmatota archaeon]
MSDEEPRYVSLAEVKKLLNEESEERELRYEQSLALGHAETFVKLSLESTEDLIEELIDGSDFIDEESAYKLADLLPQDEEGVRAVFQQDRHTPSDDESEKIINTIKKYL